MRKREKRKDKKKKTWQKATEVGSLWGWWMLRCPGWGCWHVFWWSNSLWSFSLSTVLLCTQPPLHPNRWYALFQQHVLLVHCCCLHFWLLICVQLYVVKYYVHDQEARGSMLVLCSGRKEVLRTWLTIQLICPKGASWQLLLLVALIKKKKPSTKFLWDCTRVH